MKIADDAENREFLIKQYMLCHEGEAGLLFSCEKCVFVGDCPVYGTKNYIKRKLEYCTAYLPKKDDFWGRDE